jgi:hypothetical protein
MRILVARALYGVMARNARRYKHTVAIMAQHAPLQPTNLPYSAHCAPLQMKEALTGRRYKRESGA